MDARYLQPRRLAVLLAAVALCLMGAAAQAQAAGPALRGVQLVGLREGLSDATVDSQLAVAKRAGATVVRGEALWSSLEPGAPGERSDAYLRVIDHFVQGANKRGMRVLLTVDATPCWASIAPASEKGDCSTADQRSRANNWQPSDPAQYASIARFLAARYRPALAGFGVWNEPDQANELYWKGPDKAANYAALLRATYPAVKSVAPKVAVVGGSFVGQDGRFLQALYAAGIKGSYDALGVHFYDLVLQGLKNTRKVQLANGDRKPLWLVEFGWTSCYPQQLRQEQHACVSRSVQGQNLSDIIRALRRAPYVKAAIAYNMQDDAQYQFGIIDRAGRVKPAYTQLRKAFRTKRLGPRRIKVRLSRSRGRVVVNVAGPAGDNYEMDVSKNNRVAYRVAFRLDRNDRFRLVLPPQLGSRGLKARVFQYFLGGRGTTARLR